MLALENRASSLFVINCFQADLNPQRTETPDENLMPTIIEFDSSVTGTELAEILESQPVIKAEFSNAEREHSPAVEEPPAKRIRTSNVRSNIQWQL